MSRPLVVLVTGATAGIGRAAALSLAKEGHHVIATGRREDALEALRDAGRGLRLDAVRLDVTDDASVASAVDEIERLTDGHGVDVLINNAGYGLPGPIADVSDAAMRAQFETNVFGAMRVVRAFLPKMIARRSGKILNVSSIGGRVTFPMFGVYNATKYALESLSDALRMEVRPFGIDVVLIEPGPIKSEFADRSMREIQKMRPAHSPWEAIYARADALAAESDRMAGEPEDVVRAMRHAIRSRRPYARYVMPFRSLVGMWFLAMLPTRARDALLSAFVGLSARRLRNAPPALPVTT